MRKSRRLVVAVAASGLVAAGGITWGLVANANTAAFCNSNTDNTAPITCSITDQVNGTTINTPSAITGTVTLLTGDGATTNDQYIAVTYQMFCSQGGASATTTEATAPKLPAEQAISVGHPVTDTLVLGEAAPDSCTVNNLKATLEVSTDGGTNFSNSNKGSFRMELDWTPASTPSSATPTPTTSTPPPTHHVSVIQGIGGKCLDDRGNSSRNRTPVIIWSCNSSDSAQGWAYSNGELVHNGKCANDQGGGGSGSKVILWTCNHSSNEVWFHSSSNGEFVLSSTTHGLICLDDPGSSRTNGTQLIVWKCHNTSNQHWS